MTRVKEGDLVFVEIGNDLFENVAKTQNHWATHVGVALRDSRGQWYVAESTIPVSKETPFCDYIKKGASTRVGVRRLKARLTESGVRALKVSARSKMGVPYHLGFKLYSTRQFCSKFVDQVYSEALGLRVGYEQSFRELMDETPYPEVEGFWRRWFLGRIPWSRLTVTPGSQYLDPRFVTVFEWKAPGA